jgi:hypothetical protein
MVATILLDVEDLAALPDDGSRHELLRGALLTMPRANDDHRTVSLGTR